MATHWTSYECGQEFLFSRLLGEKQKIYAMLCCVALTMLGCSREIVEVTIDMVPNRGCAPLQVSFIGKAEMRTGVQAVFNWTLGEGTQLHGPRATHTFTTPGAYPIVLTVQGEQQTQTRTATLDVGEAELPRLPGLYVQQGCVYRSLPEVEEKTVVKRLGKTSLQDLQQRIVGRELSTTELVTHPLWRREHTHTIHTIDRDQFVDVPLDRFHTLGFVSIGEDVSEVSLFRIPPRPELAEVLQTQMVTRVVDSWELENIDPEPYTLTRTRVTAKIWRFTPEAQLQEGLYVIDVKREDNAAPGMRPVALVAAND